MGYVLNDNLAAMAYDIYMHTFFSKKPNAKLKDILTEAEQRAYSFRHGLLEAEYNEDSEYPAISAGNVVQRAKHDEQLLHGVGGA